MLIPIIIGFFGASILSETAEGEEEEEQRRLSYPIFVWEDGAMMSRIINGYDYYTKNVGSGYVYLSAQINRLDLSHLMVYWNPNTRDHIFFRVTAKVQVPYGLGIFPRGFIVEDLCATNLAADCADEGKFGVRFGWLMTCYLEGNFGTYHDEFPFGKVGLPPYSEVMGSRQYLRIKEHKMMIKEMSKDGAPAWVAPYEMSVYQMNEMKNSLFLMGDVEFLEVVRGM